MFYNLHALTANVMLRSDVELMVLASTSAKLTVKGRRGAQRLCRDGFLKPTEDNRYELSFDGQRVVNAYRNAGWIP